MAQATQPLILFTGGHFSAAQAVLSEMQIQGYSNFVWVGHKYNQKGSHEPSLEFKTISEMGIKFVDLKSGKLIRNWREDFIGAITNFLMIFVGLAQSIGIIIRYRPKLIMSFGGYIALPIVLWGKLFGAKVISHEQTAVAGLANRVIAKIANKMMVTWESSLKYYPANKTIVSGNPLRKDIFEVKSNKFNFPNELPTIAVVGGNQGSHVINQAIFDRLPTYLEIANIIHQTGNSTATNDYLQAEELSRALPENLQSRYYHATHILAGEIGEMFSKASLAVSRAGANFTAELIATAVPTIFIPIPWVSHNEQFHQAKVAEALGIGIILAEKDLTADILLETVKNALITLEAGKGFDGNTLETVRQASRAAVKLDAAQIIVAEAIKLLN